VHTRIPTVATVEVRGCSSGLTSLSPPSPQVVGRLDMVDDTMLSFFQPAAEKVMSSADPTKAMAAALAALSGIK
jgi:hypothetical protein